MQGVGSRGQVWRGGRGLCWEQQQQRGFARDFARKTPAIAVVTISGKRRSCPAGPPAVSSSARASPAAPWPACPRHVWALRGFVSLGSAGQPPATDLCEPAASPPSPRGETSMTPRPARAGDVAQIRHRGLGFPAARSAGGPRPRSPRGQDSSKPWKGRDGAQRRLDLDLATCTPGSPSPSPAFF